ncbi:Iron-sulfur cluster carrier protein [bacterium HR33]|nr:Iron-sulfur cluster carrier protein [bacterium HR33]
MSPRLPRYHEVGGEDRSRLLEQVLAQRERVEQRLAQVRRVVAVMSGKGGVGKSYFTAVLAGELAQRFDRIGVLDADLAGPTVAALLDARGPLGARGQTVTPAAGRAGIQVFSADLLLPEGEPLRWKEPAGERFVWRGALEAGVLREFLSDVEWGPLDFLLIDLPPGASQMQDLAELVPRLSGAVAVTIPSEESRRAVSRAMRAAKEAGVRLLGVVENMSSYRCPGCGGEHPLFRGSAAEELAGEFGLSVLGRLPFEPRGASVFLGSERREIGEIADRLLELLG